MQKITPFSIHNDTQDWVVMVSDKLGRFSSKEEAERVYDLIFGDDGIIDSSPFGSCSLLDPGHKPHFPADYDVAITKVSELATIDIEQYIIEAWTKYKTPSAAQKEQAERLSKLPRLFDDE